MKPKIIIDRKTPSSEEILKHKNFSGVLKGVQNLHNPYSSSNWFISSLAIASLALVVTLLVMLDEKEPQNKQEPLAINAEDTLVNKMHYDEDSPCIQTPFPGAEKPFSHYEIDADKGGKFEHPSGSVVSIPAKSLIDENGNSINGKVDISYREFHDQVDILLSGIPMHYDSAGYSYQFQSAGMMEIRATQNGKAVQLANGKQLTIQFASRVAGTEYNAYELDTTARNWVFIGKDKVESIALKKNSTTTSPLDEKDILEMKAQPEIKKKEQELMAVRHDLNKIKQSQPIAPRKLNNQKYNFDIDINPREFPELAVFRNMYFEVGNENVGFSQNIYSTVWDDMKLISNNTKSNYTLELTKGGNKKRFVVYPVFDGKDFEEAQKKFNEKFNQYEKLVVEKEKTEAAKAQELAKLENEWKKERLAQKEKYANEIAEDQRQLIEAERRKKQSIQTTANLNQYGLVLVNGEVQNINGVSFPSNAAIVTRTLQVSGFGTFNCDSPQKWPSGARQEAQFADNVTHKNLPCDKIYLVIANRNLYFPFFRESWMNFTYNPKMENMLIAPLRDGRVAVMSPEEFDKVNPNDNFATFELKVSEEKITSEEDLRKFIKVI